MSSFEKAAALLAEGDDDAVVAKTIEEIVAREPDLIQRRDEKGWTLLHHALRNGNYPVAEFLLHQGADPNAITNDGMSPLQASGKGASEEGEEACRELLRSKGGRYTQREELSELIAEGNNDEVIRRFEEDRTLLSALDPTWGPYLHVAARFGQGIRILEYLLENGVDPDVPNEEDETALHQAYKNPAAVRVLVEHGANINRRDNEGFTPLHMAVGHDKEETATMLVECGADLNATTNDGETVLDWVYETCFPGYKQLGRYLKAKGARFGKRKRE